MRVGEATLTELKFRPVSHVSWVAESEDGSVATVVYEDGFYHWRLWSPMGLRTALGQKKTCGAAKRAAERAL